MQNKFSYFSFWERIHTIEKYIFDLILHRTVLKQYPRYKFSRKEINAQIISSSTFAFLHYSKENKFTLK